MANFTHKVTQGYTTPAGSVTSTTATYIDDAEIGLDVVCVNGETAQEYDIAVTLARMRSCCLTSDKAVTIKTNSSTTPQETITLAAGQSIIWADDHTEAAPFLGNVTKFFVANASGADARIRFSALLHQSV